MQRILYPVGYLTMSRGTWPLNSMVQEKIYRHRMRRPTDLKTVQANLNELFGTIAETPMTISHHRRRLHTQVKNMSLNLTTGWFNFKDQNLKQLFKLPQYNISSNLGMLGCLKKSLVVLMTQADLRSLKKPKESAKNIFKMHLLLQLCIKYNLYILLNVILETFSSKQNLSILI